MSQSIKICVIGVGYVGQHLLNTFKNGYDVIGIDLNQKRVKYLKHKFKNLSNIKLQTTYENLEDCDAFLISVPTLVKDNDIDMSYLYNVKDKIKDIVKVGALVVVESSVYVGATREIFGNFKNNGIFVGFSPERVDPGRVEPKIEDIPKIISGIDDSSLQKIKNIYSKVIKNIVPVSSTECAEMCKLYENCFRMVNIAYVNEIADMCNDYNIDCYEMIEASSTKPFGFMPFFPGVGVGGHCIPVNPYYLFKNGTLPVLQFATDIMNFRPKKKASEIITKYKDSQNILICGIGFKKGEFSLTNSPGYELYKQLMNHKNISIFDPYAEENSQDNTITFVNKSSLKQILNTIDLVIVIHSYANKLFKKYEKEGGKVIWYTTSANL
jgi:nucleotide sugar dehydrogenase